MSPGPGRGVTYTRDHDTHPQYEARLSPACDTSSAGGGVSPYVRCVRTDGCDHAHGDRREVAGGGPSASPAHAPALDTGCRRNCSVAARQMLAQGLSNLILWVWSLRRVFGWGDFLYKLGFYSSPGGEWLPLLVNDAEEVSWWCWWTSEE